MKNLNEQVKNLAEMITKGDHVKAIEVFYAEDTEMQENEQEPRRGKVFCMANEQKMLDSIKSVKSTLLNQSIDNQRNVVFSEWEFEFTYPNEQVFRLTEVSVQYWVNNLVQKEKFYYKEFIKVK